jgi:hypothetical protein
MHAVGGGGSASRSNRSRPRSTPTRNVGEAELGSGRYREELECGAGNGLADELALVREKLKAGLRRPLPKMRDHHPRVRLARNGERPMA